MRQSLIIRKFIGLFLLAAILFGNISAFAQTKRGAAGGSGQTASNQKKDAAAKDCKGNYTGVVKYNRTVKQNHSGQYGSFFSRTFVYESTIAIRDDARAQGSLYPQGSGVFGSFNLYGTATAAQSETMDDKQVSEKDDYCKLTLKGAAGKTRVHCESESRRDAKANGTGDAGVFLSFKGDKYTVSVENPNVEGQWTSSSAAHCSGTCGADKPLNSSDGGAFTDGERGAESEDTRFNPTSFNRLSGSSTKVDGEETITISWNLSRCAPPLQIDDLEFEQHEVPDAVTWHGIDSLAGATDGNIVKVKAKVFNNGGDTAYANVKFSETTSGEQLPNGTVSVAVKPGEARDVEYEWDTSGYSWDDFQKQKSDREIKVEVEGDSKTAKIKILPKPVILVHGLWSNAAAWSEYQSYLNEAHSFAWKSFAVGADAEHGKMNTGDHPGNSGATNTVFQNAQELAKQIKWTREQTNSWHVDIVAHSMGGLISRQYINTFMLPVFDGKPEVKHLVMLGTPNMGSPCADLVGNIFEFFEQNDMNAMRELRPSVVAEYNKKVTNRKGVKFSILAGVPVPRICQKPVFGDGVVEIASALYNISDRNFAPRHHLDLTGKEDFQEFVLPRLAVGPRGARNEQTAMLDIRDENNFALANDSSFERERGGGGDRYGFAKYFQNASYKRENAAPDSDDSNLQDITTRQKIELQAKEAKEIEIPVKDGAAAGIVLVASPAVNAILIDASGANLGESKAGMSAMKEMFRTIAVEKQITNGVWKLKLENLGNEAATVFVGGFVNSASEISNFTVAAGKPNAAGQVPLSAKWTQNNSPVLNAKITANVGGQTDSIEFFDDGAHGDGAASDGVFGATTAKLEKGDYYIEANATANNQTATAVANFNVGGGGGATKAATPAKSAAKPSAAKKRQ